MGSTILDLITQASSLPLGELHARTVGDATYTASVLTSLLHDGVIKFENKDGPPLVAGSNDIHDRLVTILNSGEKANDVYVMPTTLSFRRS